MVNEWATVFEKYIFEICSQQFINVIQKLLCLDKNDILFLVFIMVYHELNICGVLWIFSVKLKTLVLLFVTIQTMHLCIIYIVIYIHFINGVDPIESISDLIQ